MDLSNQRATRYLAYMLIAAVVTQTVYTVLYLQYPDVPRGLIWGFESVLFLLIAAVALVPMVKNGKFTFGFAAIGVSAVLNFLQVGIGATMFGAFRDGATAVEGTAPMAAGVVAFSFFIYNGAKVLLGLAAVRFGKGCMDAGGKTIGGLTVAVGAIAAVANAASMIEGRGVFGELPIAGGSGVLATLLLAVVLLGLSKDEG